MKHSWISSLVLLTLGMCATLGTAYFVHNATHDRDLERFNRLAERLRRDVDQHANQLDLALRAIRSIFSASNNVEQHEYLSVTNAMDIQSKLPGVDGVIYAELVANESDAINAFRQELLEQGIEPTELPTVRVFCAQLLSRAWCCCCRAMSLAPSVLREA